MPQIIVDIGDLITFRPLADANRCTHITPRDLGRQGPKAWLAHDEGRVVASGDGEVPGAYRDWPKVSAGGGLLMPGLVDSHTHALFAGSRAEEFWRRANGATYQEIAAAGGGIRSTMTATRQASDEQLLDLLGARLKRMLRLGTTTVEVKSGYGLSVEQELRLLRLLKKARETSPQTLSVTCLALHASSPEHSSNQEYAAACCEKLLPIVASEGLAAAVDAFVEPGYFSPAQAGPYVKLARSLGLQVRIHADEFADGGGAGAAAAWGAASADHLQYASREGIAAMAAAGVTATLLPGTSLYTKIPFTDARPFVAAGVAVAIASDFNPGSCLLDHLAQLTTIACIHNGLLPAQALAAVTFVPAVSLGMGRSKGALAAGFDADLCLYPLPDVETWLADSGRTKPSQVWLRGKAS